MRWSPALLFVSFAAGCGGERECTRDDTVQIRVRPESDCPNRDAPKFLYRGRELGEPRTICWYPITAYRAPHPDMPSLCGSADRQAIIDDATTYDPSVGPKLRELWGNDGTIVSCGEEGRLYGSVADVQCRVRTVAQIDGVETGPLYAVDVIAVQDYCTYRVKVSAPCPEGWGFPAGIVSP